MQRRLHVVRRELPLRNDAGEQFPVRTDARGRSRIYASRVLDATPQVPELLEAGVTRLGADCTLLAPDEVAQAIGRIVRAVEAARSGRRPESRLAGGTSGHLLQPIG